MTAAVLAPMARRDLLNAVRWISRDNPAAAHALRAAILLAAQRIGAHPDIGTRRADLSDTYRFWTLTGFPCVVAYLPARQPALIIRILHGARHFPAALEQL